MSEDAYEIIAAKLGYAEGIKHEKLVGAIKRVITPSEAKLVLELPAKVEELAERLKDNHIQEKLDSLFHRGVILRSRSGTYRLFPTVIQFRDASTSVADMPAEEWHEIADRWEELVEVRWYDDYAHHLVDTKDIGRVIPAWKAIKDMPQEDILPYEDPRQMVEKARAVAIIPCPCRRTKWRVQQSCAGWPDISCMQFDNSAEYETQRKNVPLLSREEALNALEETEEHGMVHLIPNAMQPVRAMCNCCGDCCIALMGYREAGVLEEGIKKSRFEASVDTATCNGCQTCIERCQFDAISLEKVPGSKKMKARVDPEKCWGCGMCVIKCKEGAIKFRLVRPPEHIPLDRRSNALGVVGETQKAG